MVSRVRPRDVWTVVWVVLVSALCLFLLYQIRRVLLWLLIAVFFAAVLSPLVAFLERRRFRRGLAVAVVTLGLIVLLAGIGYAFARPLVSQAVEFAQNLPQTIDRIREAPLVKQLLERFNIQNRVDQVSADLPDKLVGLSGPILSVFKTIGELIIGGLSVLVLTVFLLLYGPRFVTSGLDLIGDPHTRARVQRIGSTSLRGVSGWVAGNVITSFLAALTSMGTFAILGLPYAVLLGLWVGVADLIPLVGATLGAIPAIIVAFLHSTTAGIVVVVFFVVYQQFENHVLQPAVYGKTIRLNPFVVLLAVLIGVELLGFVGALLALPVAGVVQEVVADVMRERRGRLVHSETEVASLPRDGPKLLMPSDT
jgi:predicted PurR-regulated permease PerM